MPLVVQRFTAQSFTAQSFTARSVLLSSLWMIVLSLTGCHISQPTPVAAPQVKSRFTANPLQMEGDPMLLNAPQSPRLRLGLAVQSNDIPANVSFGARLATVLIRELQLSGGSFRVFPMEAPELYTSVPTLDQQVPSDVITVSLQEPLDSLPPQFPPHPGFDSANVPIVDQILVVRILEYRPYYPILATLEFRLLNAATQDEIFATTATWSGVDYELHCDCCDDEKKSRWFSPKARCQPSPGHNSPQALMHRIATDMTSWLCVALNAPVMGDIQLASHDTPSSDSVSEGSSGGEFVSNLKPISVSSRTGTVETQKTDPASRPGMFTKFAGWTTRSKSDQPSQP